MIPAAPPSCAKDGDRTMKTQTKIGLKCFMAAAMTFCMVAVAELTGEKEIIFPEIAALVTGAWLARKQPWNVSKTVLWITITLSAFAGVAIVKHIHVSLPFQLALAFVFTMVILTAFGTTFVPIVCACILPVFIGTDSHVYTLSVSIMALIIIMVQHLLEKNGLHEKKAFEEIGISKQVLARNAMRIALFLLVAMPPLYFGHLYFIAPPIIVGYVELSDRNSTARQSPLTIWLLFIVSSVLGYLAKEANISM
ncbi:MAG: hypothetical protein RBS57_16565, partial [Desulforhabdus sp.]|nr:hypothetical protein [Desulforhabdus sp.]